jgi:2-polyprenyl-3-methyl-5-hydroxy-6-metoxy-1,4-benzoquinol methylase
MNNSSEQKMTQDDTKHLSAAPSHYDQEAKHYDEFNEKRSVQINQIIEKILRKSGVHTVLDLTCGTGSQVFWLEEYGFEAIGIDINEKMLAIARKKSAQKNLNLKFAQGDMRSCQQGKFDAVLTIFNSIGHVTKNDFGKTLKNIHDNLKPGGLYIFDIFNLAYLQYENNITKLTIDWQKKSGDITAREIQYSTISNDGILASYDIYHEQTGNEPPKISNAFQTLQVYSAEQLKSMLKQAGFEVIQQTDVDGTDLKDNSSERILTVAKKT